VGLRREQSRRKKMQIQKFSDRGTREWKVRLQQERIEEWGKEKDRCRRREKFKKE
jgi:hypothetical protein